MKASSIRSRFFPDLPSAGFGALLSLYLFHMAATKGWVSPLLDMNLDIYGFVGIIMLIGIVKKNAIMMIDFALEAQRKEGKSPAEAIYQGCLVRFRPIMMTTMAALMGTLPIALGFGAGGEARRPLGVSVVGGLAFSQLVTLFLTPVVYIYMEDAKRWGAQYSAAGTTLSLKPAHPRPAKFQVALSARRSRARRTRRNSSGDSSARFGTDSAWF